MRREGVNHGRVRQRVGAAHACWIASDAGIRSLGSFCMSRPQKSLAESLIESQSGDGKRSVSWQIMRACGAGGVNHCEATGAQRSGGGGEPL